MPTGLRKLKKKLNKIGSAVIYKYAEIEAEKIADEFVAEVKPQLPVKTGNLRRSARVVSLGRGRFGSRAKFGGALTTVKSKNGKPFDYSRIIEFKYRPTILPIYRINKRKYRARMAKAMKRGVEEAWRS